MMPMLSTTYCDDVRQEVSGKVSLIGVYNSVLYVPQFPVTLPKLCIVVTYTTPRSEPPASLKIRVLKDSDPLADLDATPEYLAQLKKFAASSETIVPLPDDVQPVIATNMHVSLSPLVFDKPCFLRVVAITEKGETRGLGLQVQKQPA